MTLKRLVFVALVLALAFTWLGCQSSNSGSSSSGGNLSPYYVKGQGYNPGSGN